MPYTEQELRREARQDQLLARQMGPSGRIGRNGRHTFRGSLKAFMAVYNNEGPEVATAAAKGYWDDQKRRFPWLDPEQGLRTPSTNLTRLGRASERTVYRPGEPKRTVRFR